MKGKKKLKFHNNNEGYTFVETMVVLGIIAVLAAGTSVSASKLISMAKKTSARNQIDQYSSAVQTYFLDCGRFPTTAQGLEALWRKPDIYPVPEKWNGPYLERKITKDPWGNEYLYISGEDSVFPSDECENLPYVLISYGADGKEGGIGNNEDICSWN